MGITNNLPCYTILMDNSIIAVIFLGASTIILIFFKPSKITNYPSVGTSLVMFGDSLIEGVGATEGNDLPSLLSKKLGQKVINMGMRGQTSAQGLARIGQVIKHDPKVVMVLFGGNDYLHQVPKEETFRNIDKIVVTLQGYGAVVVLLGIQGGILEDPYREEFRRIAHNRGTLYVPDILGGVIGEQDLMFDEVHPNDKGYEILAEKIYPIVKKGI